MLTKQGCVQSSVPILTSDMRALFSFSHVIEKILCYEKYRMKEGIFALPVLTFRKRNGVYSIPAGKDVSLIFGLENAGGINW